ncbi:MAG: IclR family transcriptional regulator [Actinomycetota bacterium]|nr:IclR family transcriptional regulator [Actinomycetota bacterium]
MSQLHTADRALQMLQAFSSELPTMTVGRLATVLGVHKSTASRLAATLSQRGFLERDAKTNELRLGPELGRLGLLVVGGGVDLVAIARACMGDLAGQTGETVNIAVLDSAGTEVTNIAQVDGPHIVGIGQWTGRRTPVHPTANGKVLLAYRTDGIPTDLSLEAYTKRTISDRAVLEAQLAQIRNDGCVTVLGEFEDGLHAVSAPVFDSQGCRAALSVSGPSYRLTVERLPQLTELCRRAARDLSQRLGGSDGR